MNLFLQKFKEARGQVPLSTPEEEAEQANEVRKETNKNYVKFKQGLIDKGMAQQQGMGPQPAQGAM